MSVEIGMLIIGTICIVLLTVFVNLSLDRRKRKNEIYPMTGKLSVILNAVLPVLLLASFLIIGFVTRELRYELFDGPVHYETLVSGLIMIATLILLLVWNVVRGYFTSFQLEAFIVISSFISGWGISEDALWDDLAVSICGFWIVVAVAGSLIFMIGRLVKYRVRKERYLKESTPEGGYLHRVPSGGGLMEE
ncbi:MAG: hypothetical protein ACMUHY_04350 [Thermoplasmatota archaeon]